MLRKRLTANIRTFMPNSAVVTGACPPKNSARPLLIATIEKLRFVPHSWQRVALTPTNVPQAGQILGRGAGFSAAKRDRNEFFQRSNCHCHRFGSGNSPPCDLRIAFL